jgi:hypothetical protein
MPRSRHRRTPGGKAVAHSGRGKQQPPPLYAERVLWQRFRAGYTAPFHEKYRDDSAPAPPGAGFMLDLIASSAFDGTGNGSLRPVPRADVFGEFMWPLDPEDFPDEPVPPKHETPESAEAALAFLVEQEMVEVAGDTITVPARFWSGGQPPAP